MSVRSFRSVFMVASCAGAALGCYLVSLRVASERAALEQVEQEIVLAQRDIRVLQTEIGTRGRLAQLERWNVKVLALSAPSADQFVNGGFELARMVAPHHKVDLEAPVVLASAPAEEEPVVQGVPERHAPGPDEGVSARELLQVASLKTQPARPAPRLVEPKAEPLPPVRKAVGAAATAKPIAVKPPLKATGKPSAADKKVVDKTAAEAARRVTKAAAVAKPDPLAPLAGAARPAKPKTLAAATKDSARKP